MPKYHINPRTGDPTVCKAEYKCPFGDLEADHYDSREEAEFYYEQRMADKLIPSFEPGKIMVAPMPENYRQNDNQITLPKGVYAVIDPSYIVGRDPALWDRWVETINSEEGGWNRGAIGALINGYPVAAVYKGEQMKEGIYNDQQGRYYHSLNGMIGLVPMSLVNKLGMDEMELLNYGTIMNSAKPIVIKNDAENDSGAFGEKLHIDLSKPMEDPYEEAAVEAADEEHMVDSLLDEEGKYVKPGYRHADPDYIAADYTPPADADSELWPDDSEQHNAATAYLPE